MGGFLGALGYLAPVGETLAGIANPIQARAQEQQSQTKLLEDLVSGNPEYQPILDYAKSGGQDVLSLLGGNVGKNVQSAFKSQRMAEIARQNQEAGGSPIDFANRMMQAGMYDSPDEYFADLRELAKPPPITMADMQGELRDYVQHPNPNTPPETLARWTQLANEPNPNQAELIDATRGIQTFDKYEKPTPLHFDSKDVLDPTSGFNVTWQYQTDPVTGEERGHRALGIHLNAQQESAFSDARALLSNLPDAQKSAYALQDHMVRDLGLVTEPQQRTWIAREFRSYNAGRKISAEQWYNPAQWYYMNLPGVDPVFNDYATSMGMIQAMQAAPMHIFRSQGMFQEIAPHVDAPQDIPANNIGRLNYAQKRFGGDVQRIINLERGLGLPQVPGGPAAPPAPPAAAAPPALTARSSDPVRDAFARKYFTPGG